MVNSSAAPAVPEEPEPEPEPDPFAEMGMGLTLSAIKPTKRHVGAVGVGAASGADKQPVCNDA